MLECPHCLVKLFYEVCPRCGWVKTELDFLKEKVTELEEKVETLEGRVG